MISEIATVKRSTTLNKLLEIFSKFHISPLLPVVDNSGNLVGTITLEDIIEQFSVIPLRMSRIAKYAYSENLSINDLQNVEIPEDAGTLFLADDLMNKKTITIPASADIKEAERMMNLNRIEIVPVLDGKKLVGMVTKFDIVLGILRNKGIF
ncbi:MAG: CBS domain-containing protein [Elusimicrobia bacterium]|nr:CBS domain-containing protein [Elusimicrobiota bacterium]